MPMFQQAGGGEDHMIVHEMVPTLDAGAVLGTLVVPIRERDRLDRLIIVTNRERGRLHARVLRELAAATDDPQPLDRSEGDVFRFRHPDGVEALRRRGNRMLR